MAEISKKFPKNLYSNTLTQIYSLASVNTTFLEHSWFYMGQLNLHTFFFNFEQNLIIIS